MPKKQSRRDAASVETAQAKQSDAMTASGGRQASPAKPVYQSALKVGLVVLVVGLSVACVQYKVPTIMTAIAPRFHLSTDASSWLMSIFTLAGIFFALPAGGMAQRFGFKKVMLCSSALIVAGSVIGLLAGGNGVVLIASRAVEGISLTIITTCAPIAIQRCVNPDRIGLATGLWGCWGSGGAVIASVLTPQIFASAGFEGVWIVFAVFAAFAALLLLLFVREPSRAIEAAASEQSAARVPRYSELATKNVALFLISFVVLNLLMLALLGMLPSVLMLPEKGFSREMAGFASTFASLLALVSTPLFGLLADKIGRVKPLLVFTLTMLGPCLFLMYTQTGMLFWVGAAALGLLGFGSIGLSIAAWMQIIPRPELVPKGMGVLTLVQSVGQFLGTFLVQILLGPTFENWFFAGIVLMVVGLLGAGAAAMVRFR